VPPGSSSPPPPGTRKDLVREAIDGLHAGGSAAGGAGIQLANDVARADFFPHGNNRVILATDGDFNVGVTEDAAVVRLIGERRQGDLPDRGGVRLGLVDAVRLRHLT